MTPSEQVQYESRVRMRYAVIAFVGGIMLVAAQFVSLSGSHPDVDETTLSLIAYAANGTREIISGFLGAIAMIALGAVVAWLFLITKARRPQMRKAVLWCLIVGIVIATIGLPVKQFAIVHVSHQFMHTSYLSYPEANHLENGAGILMVSVILLLADVLIGVAMYIILLNSLRVGLFSRPVAYLGLAAAALLLISNLFAPGVALFAYLQILLEGIWMVLAAVIFAKRWPGAKLPTWEDGVAAPWAPLQGQGTGGRSQSPGQIRKQQQRDSANQRQLRPRDAQRIASRDEQTASEHKPSPSAGTPKRKKRRG